jgi:hypothetical protein
MWRRTLAQNLRRFFNTLLNSLDVGFKRLALLDFAGDKFLLQVGINQRHPDKTNID